MKVLQSLENIVADSLFPVQALSPFLILAVEEELTRNIAIELCLGLMRSKIW